ncbi:hypothetical protein OIE43_44180 [Streptomyces pseudovenezuelae]|uniref:hypothetical protein n=1 Tax=Streptomyces pseudovenezuelae TaxID=67350 RepID=UPI002E2FB986|nr:hypothetical protein [Streptomyces pseudovenezuelae]
MNIYCRFANGLEGVGPRTVRYREEQRHRTSDSGFRSAGSRRRVAVVLRSRRGTQMAAAFPEVVAGAGQLPDATAFDGELVVWENGRLAFERLQERLHRRGSGAARAADLWPAHFVFPVKFSVLSSVAG